MAEADRIAAALQYIDEQKPADPFASLKSDPIGALRSAWERKVDPIINNAKRTFATGGVLGDILRAYGEAGAPANRAVLKGMGMPYKDPAVVNTPPTLAPDNSYGNMGDATAQTFGTIIGDPLNFVQPGAARIANALKFAKPDALKMLNEMSQGARSPMNVIGSKKQALIDAGFYHPIGGGKKLPMPVGDMKFTAVANVPKVDQRVISPESMQGGTLVPAIGDRTAAGAMLYDVGGHRLTSPVQLEGGADFMRTHAPYGSAWASDKGVITALAKKVRAAGEVGDVYMPHVAMSHTSGDFSKMMSDALLEQMKSSTISKTAKLEFDRNMRRVRPEWKGIDHPEALDQLKSNGAVRTAFVAETNLDQFANRGFPNVAQTRVAITDPNLINVPMHSSGYTVAKMNPEGLVISNPVAPHSTYSTQLGGQYAGGFAQPVPRDIMFPDFYSGRRAMSGDPAGDVRSFQLSNPIQKADQKWLDGVMKYLEEAKD